MTKTCVCLPCRSVWNHRAERLLSNAIHVTQIWIRYSWPAGSLNNSFWISKAQTSAIHVFFWSPTILLCKHSDCSYDATSQCDRRQSHNGGLLVQLLIFNDVSYLYFKLFGWNHTFLSLLPQRSAETFRAAVADMMLDMDRNSKCEKQKEMFFGNSSQIVRFIYFDKWPELINEVKGESM